MIAVDSSVWISALRRPQSSHGATLRALLDADDVALPLPVRIEIIAGVARRDRSALARGLSALPVLRPADDTWHLIERWVSTAAEKGQRFSVTDLLIAGLAKDIDALVWSLDEDFTRMAALGFVRLYA